MSYICILFVWLCCISVTFKRDLHFLGNVIEISLDGGKVCMALMKTLLLVWVGLNVGACAVYVHRTA